MTTVSLEYDERTDSLYLAFNEREWASQRNLDDRRAIDYAADGTVIGIELLSASAGVDTDGLPYRADVESILKARAFPVLQPR